MYNHKHTIPERVNDQIGNWITLQFHISNQNNDKLKNTFLDIATLGTSLLLFHITSSSLIRTKKKNEIILTAANRFFDFLPHTTQEKD